MRVTSFGMTNSYLLDLNDIQDSMNKSMQQLSTGKRINAPGDDPVATVQDMQLRTTINNVNQYLRNTDDANVWYTTTESSLSNVQNSLQRLRTLVVEANNGTMSADNRQNIASNVDQLLQNIEQQANTRIGDQYIFGGTNTTTTPLSVNTSGSTPVFSWNGNSSARMYQIGESIQIQTNTDGKQIFSSVPSGTSQGLMDTVARIASDLRNPSVSSTALGTDIADIDTHLKNVTAAISELGARQNRVMMLKNQYNQNLTALQQRLSNVEDADMATVISQFNNQQTVYKAALSTAQKMILPTLADYLK